MIAKQDKGVGQGLEATRRSRYLPRSLRMMSPIRAAASPRVRPSRHKPRLCKIDTCFSVGGWQRQKAFGARSWIRPAAS